MKYVLVAMLIVTPILSATIAWTDDAASSGIATAHKPVIFVCGDSTAKNSGTGKNGSPVAGWGTPIAEFFDPSKAVVNNVGHAGRSSLTYYNGDWPNVLPKIGNGDFVLLVFGINDGSTPNGIGDDVRESASGQVQHTYGWYMSKMATDAQAKGAHVVLLTVTTRNIWRSPKVKFNDGTPIGELPADYDPKDDRIERGTGGGKYTQWTKDIGAKLHLPVFDLTNYCADQYEKMGRETVNKFYSDHNHTYRPGAEFVAASIVSGLKAIQNSPFLDLLSAEGKALPVADAKYVNDNKAEVAIAPSMLERSFEQPADDARIMVRWWWYGPAVTKPMLEQEMQTMKAGGIGGFEVQPTYPLSVDGELPGVHNIKFLSPEFFNMLRFTADKATELGLRMDLTLGSGWPYGGPMFSKSEGAGEIFEQTARPAAGATSVALPRALVDGQTLIGAFAMPAGGTANPDTLKEISVVDSKAQIPAEMTGPVEVHFYISGRTGMQVKRPALGAEGNVIDHLSQSVVQKFIEQVAEPSIAACGPHAPYAIFCDSLEVGREDWTDNLLTEFQKRRGYDLRPLLPALFNNNYPKAMDIRHDWGKTLTETYNDNFNKAFKALAKTHHSRFREQAYGSPSAAEFSYADIDLPEGEGITWNQYSTTRYATSAAHLLGVPVASAESFTWLHSPVFRATPSDMKAEADLHFLQGVNQIICHGWPSTAPGVSYPGWSFYAAAVFNDKNPWWIVMPDVAKYLQRVSSMMRQGTPANDVAVYLADSDAWANFTPGNISLTTLTGRYLGSAVGTILDAGYNFDFFDDGLLDRVGKVDGPQLVFGDLKYKVAVLVDVKRIPVSTMRKLETFAKNGATVVAFYTLPSLAPGYQATEAETQEVRDIAKRLFTDSNAPGIFVKTDNQFSAALAKRLAPDVAISPASPEVAAVHRHTNDGEVYFVANTSNQHKKLQATFRIEGLQPEEWNPMTGEINPINVIDKTAGGTTVPLSLPPYGSTLIVWTRRSLPAKPSSTVAALPQPLDLSGNWSVTIGPDAKPVTMEKLRSWTVDSATKNFSGVASYQKQIQISADMLQPGIELSITFGEGKPLPTGGRGRMQALLEAPVREAAVVYLNGKRIGSVWHPPYALNVTGALKEGENQIRIDVGNLAINHMAGHGFPNYKLQAVRSAFGNRFDPQDIQNLQPLPSGLLGPIQIVAKDRK